MTDISLDELRKTNQAVLIRIQEWTEWMPSKPSSDLEQLAVANGYTAFDTGDHEKLLDIHISATGMIKKFGGGNFSLYAFQAILAQNISSDLAFELLEAQQPDTEPIRDRRNDLLIVKGDGSSSPIIPPRKKK